MLVDIINPGSIDDLKRMLVLGRHMGFKYMLVETSELGEYIEDMLQADRSAYPKLIPIITIKPNSHVKDMVSSAIGRKIIFMNAKNREEFIRGIRTYGISVISVDLETFLQILDLRILHLLKQYHKFVELRFKGFIFASPRIRANYIRLFRRHNKLINRKDFRLIISSRATSIFEMSSPRLLRECLMMLGFKDYTIKRIYKQTPLELILTPLEVTMIREDNWLKDFHIGHKGSSEKKKNTAP